MLRSARVGRVSAGADFRASRLSQPRVSPETCCSQYASDRARGAHGTPMRSPLCACGWGRSLFLSRRSRGSALVPSLPSSWVSFLCTPQQRGLSGPAGRVSGLCTAVTGRVGSIGRERSSPGSLPYPDMRGRPEVRIHGRPRLDRKRRFHLSAVAPSTSCRHPRTSTAH